MSEYDDDDEQISELVDLAVKRVDGVDLPANGTPWLLLKSRAQAGVAKSAGGHVPIGVRRQQRERAAKASAEIPATNCSGEADSILAAVTGERTRICAAPTQDGTPCQRPAESGGRCFMHATKSVTVPGPATQNEQARGNDMSDTVKPERLAKAIARVQQSATRLAGHDPRRQAALSTALFLAMRVRNGGTVTKAEFAGLESQAQAIEAATGSYVASVTAPQPPAASTDLRSFLQQPAMSLTGVPGTDPQGAARMQQAGGGQTGIGFSKEQAVAVNQAEEALEFAKARGTSNDITAAAERLTLERLKTFHQVAGR